MSNTGGSIYAGGPSLVAPVGNSSLKNSGSTLGRLGVPVLIDQANLSAVASYTSPTFAAELYSKITMEIDGLETSASFDPILTMGGATSASGGAARIIYTAVSSNTAFDSAATTYLAILDSAGGNIDVHGIVEVFPMNTGRKRHYLARWSSSGAIGLASARGANADTTHGITSVGWTGSTSFTGVVRVWGVPA